MTGRRWWTRLLLAVLASDTGLATLFAGLAFLLGVQIGMLAWIWAGAR